MTNIGVSRALIDSNQTMPRTVMFAVTACLFNQVALFAWEIWDSPAQVASSNLSLDLLIAAISWLPSLVDLGLLWMIVRRANWARKVFAWWVIFWVALFFSVVCAVTILDRDSLGVIFEDGFWVFAVVVSSVISLTAVALLFNEKSSCWFKTPARQEPSC